LILSLFPVEKTNRNMNLRFWRIAPNKDRSDRALPAFGKCLLAFIAAAIIVIGSIILDPMMIICQRGIEHHIRQTPGARRIAPAPRVKGEG